MLWEGLQIRMSDKIKYDLNDEVAKFEAFQRRPITYQQFLYISYVTERLNQ